MPRRWRPGADRERRARTQSPTALVPPAKDRLTSTFPADDIGQNRVRRKKTWTTPLRVGATSPSVVRMLFAALRDMQWRRRRLVIAIVSTGLVFGLTLVLTGLSNGFRVEAGRTVNSMGVDGFVVKAGAPGPFLGATAFSEAEVSQVAAEPGVTAAAPLAFAATSIKEGASTRTVSAFGAPERGPGMPAISQGRAPATPDEVAVSSTLDQHVGDDVHLGVQTFRIVGIVANSTTIGKAPNMFLTTEGIQRLSYNGQPMVTSIGIKGTPRALPDGYQALDPAAAVNDLLRPLKVAVQGITIMSYLLWIVAALIVGSVVYLSALERVRDFAVFKAIGVPTRSILAGLTLQAVVMALLSAVLGVGLAQLLAPLFPTVVAVPMRAYLALPLIAVAIGLLASIAGLRRAVAVDPALAFGGP
jgi:putative ABC transport system permease protein